MPVISLNEYISNRFLSAEELPESGTDYLKGWDALAVLASQSGAAEVINRKLCPNCPVSFVHPESVSLEIYGSFAGRIPVIYAGDENDFEQLVTNIVHKGVRPAGIEQTGASFVSGKTVRFIILSAKPYSNVPAAELGLGDGEWAEKSMLIRRSHECTHFFTRQTYGTAENNLHDELMADLMGLYDAFGYYKAEWFLRFMGFIPGSGGRLGVYVRDLSPEDTAALKELAAKAARGLEEWSRTDSFKKLSPAERIKRMCRAGI